jgi:predicted O-methyltransferase YrrM
MIDLQTLDYGVRQTGGNRIGSVLALINKYLADNPALPHVRMIEVGSYEGVSAVFWSHAIGDAGRMGTITCIDPWEAYIDTPDEPVARRMDGELASGIVYQRFVDNCKHEHPRVKLYSHVGTMATFQGMPASFDIVYIDGCHRFSACLTDIEVGARLLKLGGLICGDDLERQVLTDDSHALKHCEEEYRDGYHPGVSLAVSTFFGYGKIWTSNSVWAVRKTRDGKFTAEGVV